MIEMWMILGMIAVTWGLRMAPFVVPNLQLSPAILNFLNCIPAAVLAALVAEPILNPVITHQSLFQPELLAAALCLLLGILKAPMLLTVVIGMASYWSLRYFLF